MNKIAFITGSRSEYGVLRKLLKKLKNLNEFEYNIIVHGAHNLQLFGNTSDEINKDFPDRIITVDTLKYHYSIKDEFVFTINAIYLSLKQNNFTHVFLVGDRIESYASAIAAHLLKLPIFHYGGGNISIGANDDIYRYNITNLSSVHLITSKPAYSRIVNLPVINKKKVYFVGSSAVDSILDFLKNPINISSFFPKLKNKSYVLMTFHPVTSKIENTSEVMDVLINLLINLNYHILITYPNHDEGHKKIINVIEKWKNHKNVLVEKHLGQLRYFSAIYNSEFVIGNTSSGFVEVPYFSKIFFNVGLRQEGRDSDEMVINIPSDTNYIKKKFSNLLIEQQKFNRKCGFLYGNGGSVSNIIKILKNEV